MQMLYVKLAVEKISFRMINMKFIINWVNHLFLKNNRWRNSHDPRTIYAEKRKTWILFIATITTMAATIN